MKRNAILCFIFLCATCVFAEKRTYASCIDEWIEIEDSIITFNYCDPFENDICRTYKYETENNNGFEWITIKNDYEKKKFLMLKSNEFLILYDAMSPEPFFFGFYSFRRLEGLSFPKKNNIKVSSELQEKTIIYSDSNLGNLNLDEPWVEAAKGDGIGEYIILDVNARELYIVSGYISYSKPYLYDQNNRPKTIRISFIDSDCDEMIITLLDTPNPQKIDLITSYKGKMKLEILDVYKGTKYSDLCISSIIYSH